MQRARPDRPRRLGGYFQAAMRQGCDILRGGAADGGGGVDGGARCGVGKATGGDAGAGGAEGAGGALGEGSGDGGDSVLQSSRLDEDTATLPGVVRERAAEQDEVVLDLDGGVVGDDGGEGAPEGAKVRVSLCGAGHALEVISAWCAGGTCDVCQRGIAEGEDIWVCGPCNRQWWACTECKGPEEAGLPSETSPLSDDFVTLVLLPLLQALPPPSLIDPVTAKAALALASANEVDHAAWN